jgi:DNA-binding CsgD family transcriptional regulator
VIFPVGEHLYDARRAVEDHLCREHGGPFAALLATGKEGTGLSDVQREVVEASHEGLTDKQTAARLGKSASTIRNHRFMLRKRRREARAFLAIMEILDDHAQQAERFIQFHPAMPVDDERVMITEAEARKLLDKFFEGPDHSSLLRFPKKEKHKLVILRHVAARFAAGRRYPEVEVNRILGALYDDHTTLKRYLVDYRFLARERDGSEYWRTDG